MALAYLTDPNEQFMARNGVPNVGGRVRVFYDETDDPATTYRNFDGAENPEAIPLDIDGRAVIIAVAGQSYRVEVYDASGDLMWTSKNVTPMTYSENSFTDEDKEKLDSVQAGAQKNVQSDWRQADSTKDDYIKNKPQVTSITATVEDTTSAVGAADFDLTTNRVLFDETMDAGFLVPKIVTPPSDVQVLAVGAGEGGPSWKGMEDVQKHADWNCGDSTYPAFIENKPSIAQLLLTDFSGSHAVGENGVGWVEANSQDASDDPGYVQVKYTYNHQLRTRPLGYLLPSLDALPMKDADLKVLDVESVTYDDASLQDLYINDGKAYDVTLDDVSASVRLKTTSETTLHTVLKVRSGSSSDCSQLDLIWYDEALVQHRIIIPLNETDKEFYFDVYIRKVEYNGVDYVVARVSDFPCGYRQSPGSSSARDNNTNWIGRNT